MAMTQAITADVKPQALPVGSLIRLLIVAAVVLGFAVTHLTLRFELVKVQRDTNRLQSLQSTLISEIKGLQGRAEALKNPRRLYEYARLELGMVPCRPDTDRKELRLPAELHRRYELARADLARRKAPARPGEGVLDKFGDQLGVISSALAAGTK